MFKHGAKGEEKEIKKEEKEKDKDKKEEKDKDKRDDKKEERKKEKERLKHEKKAEKEDKKAEKEERKRAITTNPKSTPRDIPERSLSSPGLGGDSPSRPTSPIDRAVSPRQPAARATVNVDQLALDKDDLSRSTDQERRSSLESAFVSSGSSSPIPPQALSLPHATSNNAVPAHPHPHPQPAAPSNPLASSAGLRPSDLTKSGSVERHPEKYGEKHVQNVGLLKSKIGALPPDTKQLVEYLLNIFSRTLPDKWSAPPNLEPVAIDDQIDITLDKLVEASEILFNKDAPSLLKKYGKDLRESPNRRTDKWKSITNMLGGADPQFNNLFFTSDTLESVITSALAKPLEVDETEILADVLRLSVIHDIALKELIAVILAASRSNAHVKNKLDEHRSLSDAVIELVCSFRKLVRSPEDESQVRDLKKDGADVSESLNQSVSLLEHANMIKHAKGGNDIIHPLESFFQDQILEEIREGEKWQKTSEEAKEEKESKLRDIDEFIVEEEGKLKNVQVTITDLESKLEQKKAEEKILQVSLELKLKEREQYLKAREQAETEIKVHIDETAQHLDHHKKAEESVTKFSQDITAILDKEVSETLKKTREVLLELEKEVTFLEEKLITYERSMSLFNNADEPEVLDGLRKLFARSTAIYAESKLSVSRVSGVVELLRTVLGEDSTSVEDLAVNLEKIITRQNTLNHKYKLQKE